LNVITKRYSHGDGAYKFLRAYYENQENYPVTIWRNEQVARDYINTWTEIIARISITLSKDKLHDSFYLFSILMAVFCTLLFVTIYVFISKHTPRMIARVITFGTTCLFIYASAFPDAEIILAAPLTFWIIISLTNLITKGDTSKNNIFALLFLFIFGYGIHEALILTVAGFTTVFLGGLIFKKLVRSKFNCVLVLLLFVFSTIGLLRIVESSSKAPTSNSIFHAAVFDPRNVISQPSVFVVFAISIYCFFTLVAKNGEKILERSVLNRNTNKTFAIAIACGLLIILLEFNRRDSHWSFTANRIDLMWFLILLTFLTPLFSVFYQKNTFKDISVEKNSVLLLSILLAMTSVRSLEGMEWIQCKQQGLVLTESRGAPTSSEIRPKKTCDWGWTDPGTFLLMNPLDKVSFLPPGDENVIPDPRIVSSNEVVIFDMRLRIKN
jgi:hypothetical protein